MPRRERQHRGRWKIAVGFFNFSDHPANIPFYTFNAGLVAGSGYGLVMRELFTGEELGPIKDYCNPGVEAYGCKVYRAKVVKL